MNIDHRVDFYRNIMFESSDQVNRIKKSKYLETVNNFVLLNSDAFADKNLILLFLGFQTC